MLFFLFLKSNKNTVIPVELRKKSWHPWRDKEPIVSTVFLGSWQTHKVLYTDLKPLFMYSTRHHTYWGVRKSFPLLPHPTFIQVVNGLHFQCAGHSRTFTVDVYEWEVAALWPRVGSSKCLSGHVLWRLNPTFLTRMPTVIIQWAFSRLKKKGGRDRQKQSQLGVWVAQQAETDTT